MTQLFKAPRPQVAGTVFRAANLAERVDHDGKFVEYVTCRSCSPNRLVAGATCYVIVAGERQGNVSMADTRLGRLVGWKLKPADGSGKPRVAVDPETKRLATETRERVPFEVHCRRCDAVVDRWPRT